MSAVGAHTALLTEHTRQEIDHWVAKFPPDRKRSALIQALMAAQEQNVGYLTDDLITAVAKYLGLPAIWAYEVASFYSMFETTLVGRNNVAICTNISCWLNGAEGLVIADLARAFTTPRSNHSGAKLLF